ncbi:MAG: hypothetical protein A2283_18280 [Lentisphaerae bacterium RIFOXYA12_FULL_48_11]|nr:MAG: hypothetical protein A2283_18280 [Lentisphaerae bacterium RIFOXYA12_FULL_48_11]
MIPDACNPVYFGKSYLWVVRSGVHFARKPASDFCAPASDIKYFTEELKFVTLSITSSRRGISDHLPRDVAQSADRRIDPEAEENPLRRGN